MADRYVIGQPVVLDAIVTVANVKTDPTALTLVVTGPDGTATTFNWPSPATITRTATGVFTKTFTATTLPGTYSYVFTPTGAAADVQDGTFDIAPIDTGRYCTIEETRDWIGVDDAALDSLIDSAISAAQSWVDGRVNRRGATRGVFLLEPTATARYFDTAFDGSVWVDDIGDLEDFAVDTDTANNGTWSTSWLTTDYQLLPVNTADPYWQIVGVGTQTFPRISTRRGLVKVTARWGWPAVPAAVKQACIQKTAQIVSRRNSPNGVAGFNDFGIVRVVSTDAQIDELLERFMLVSVA